MLLTFSGWGYWLSSLGIWLVSLVCHLSCRQWTLKVPKKGKRSARVKGGVNHCDFQISKHAYSRFWEIWGEGNASPSCTLVFFLLELSSPFHVDYCSQQTLGPGWSLLDQNQRGKSISFQYWSSSEKCLSEVQIRCVNTEQDSWSPHTEVHLQDGRDSPSLNLLWLPDTATNFSNARNPFTDIFSWRRRFLVSAHISQ